MVSNPTRAARVVAVLVGVGFLFPAVYLLWETVALGADFVSTVTAGTTIGPLWNSLRLAVVTTAACVVMGTGLAFLVARTDLSGRRLLNLILPLPLAIPSFVGATALLAAFGPGALVPVVPRLDGFWGALLVLTALSYPYVYLPVRARLATTQAGLEEASQLLGHGAWPTFLRVVLPQIRGSMIAGGLLVFLYVLSDFGAVALLRYNAITRALYSARLFDRSTALTLGALLAALALAVAAASRTVEGRSTPMGGGGRQVNYGLGRARRWLQLAVMMPLGIGLVAPIAVFVFWVFRSPATDSLGYGGWGDDLTFLFEPIFNSGLAAVVASVVAAAVVLPVAYAGARSRGWWAGFSTSAVSSVFALPGLVVAFALVFWAVSAPGFLFNLYQTFPLLILGYVLHFGAQSMQASSAAVASLPRRFDEAALVLGADRWRRFRTVDFPLIRSGVLAGAGLVLLSTLKELPATLLLAPIGFQTLATRIWGAAEDGFFAEVGIASLVLVALSGTLTWFLVLRRQPDLEDNSRLVATIR